MNGNDAGERVGWEKDTETDNQDERRTENGLRENQEVANE